MRMTASQVVVKLGDMFIYECPTSAIDNGIKDLINVVNISTNKDGDIIHLPYKGTILDQPKRFLDAVQITRNERLQYQIDKMKKMQEK